MWWLKCQRLAAARNRLNTNWTSAGYFMIDNKKFILQSQSLLRRSLSIKNSIWHFDYDIDMFICRNCMLFSTGKTQDPFIDIRSLCLFSVWDCSFRFILWSAIIFAAFFFHVYLIRFRSETRLSLNWRSNMFSFFFVGMFSFLLSRMFLIPFHCYLHHQLRTEIPVCAPEHNCRLLEREQLNYAPGERKNDNIMSLYATTINTTIFIYFNYLLHFTFSLLGIFHYNC